MPGSIIHPVYRSGALLYTAIGCQIRAAGILFLLLLSGWSHAQAPLAGEALGANIQIYADAIRTLTHDQLDAVKNRVFENYQRAVADSDSVMAVVWSNVWVELDSKVSVADRFVLLRVENSSREDQVGLDLHRSLEALLASPPDIVSLSRLALKSLSEAPALSVVTDGLRIEFSNGELGVLPANSTRYFALIVPDPA